MKNRIAIITGASSGIGKATALKLAKEGARMVLNARDAGKLAAVEAEINQIHNNICRVVPGDVCDINTTGLCIAACIDTWGQPPDIFLASAGRGLPGTVITSQPENWKQLVDTNIMGLMYQLKSVGESMITMAASANTFVTHPMDIVVIGSNIGRNVSPFNSVYGATKFAAYGLTEALRRELGPKGIRVSLIEPGLVQTNFQASSGYDMEWFSRYAEEIGPVLTADDVASVITFLLQMPGNVNLDNISIRPTRQTYP
jgi:NADP-dependent 3-hydroxy acid dehydrogenase YdfG